MTKVSRAATGQVRVRYEAIRELDSVPISTIASYLEPSLRQEYTSRIYRDGWLPDPHGWSRLLPLAESKPTATLAVGTTRLSVAEAWYRGFTRISHQ